MYNSIGTRHLPKTHTICTEQRSRQTRPGYVWNAATFTLTIDECGANKELAVNKEMGAMVGQANPPLTVKGDRSLGKMASASIHNSPNRF